MTTQSILLGSGGKSRAALSFVFSANTTQTTLDITTLPGYMSGKSDVVITINSGVYVYSTNIATPALSITGATGGDTVELVNNGFILGAGGNGGTFGVAAGAGGTALSLGSSLKVTNNGYIAGGGGGGAGSASHTNLSTGLYSGGGGGAGGGAGGNGKNSSNVDSAGGAGGAPNTAGSTGTAAASAGGGGGRILPGVGATAGTLANVSTAYAPGNGGGAGGGGGAQKQQLGFCVANVPRIAHSVGGGGGGWGAAGGTAMMDVPCNLFTVNMAAGGSANNPGANGTLSTSSATPTVGGTGGRCVALNGNTVTWAALGTRYGVIS